MSQELYENITAVLKERLGPENDWIGNLVGILTGTATAEFVGIGKVEFELTDRERAEYLAAIVKSKESWLGRPIARFMSPELEELLCGHKPERYRLISR